MKTDDTSTLPTLGVTHLIETAKNSDNKLVKDAFSHADNFYKRSSDELLFMAHQVHLAFLKQQFSVENLTKKLLKIVDNDANLMIEFNKETKNYKAGETISYPLANNKILEILAGIKQLIENNLKSIVSKEPIKGYNFDYVPQLIPLIDLSEPEKKENKNFYGNSKTTFLKGAFVYTYMGITDTNINQFPSFNGKKTVWYENSASAYRCRLPTDFTVSKFEKLSLMTKTEIGHSMIIFQSGYAFGGSRELGLSPSPYSPEDCSSWIIKLTDNKKELDFGTVDFLRLWWLAFEATRHLVSSQWQESKIGKTMISRYKSLTKKEGYTYPLGTITVYRLFYQPSKEKIIEHKDEGYAGHMGIALGSISNRHYALCTGRNMPHKEGFVVEPMDKDKQCAKDEFVEVMSFQWTPQA